jgi:DnaJ like chaperone protein
MYRWIGAIAGYFFFKLPGAVLGFLVGLVWDTLNKSKVTYEYNTTRTSRTSRPTQQDVSPADFELNLLSLSAIVMKADGSASREEMQYVQQYFVQSYGKERANNIFRKFNEIVKQREVSSQKICQYLRMRTRYETRLQILHFLFNIAQADGNVSEAELRVLSEISGYLAINFRDFESIKAMFFKNPDSAYKILEIDRNATVEEIKSAYREMAKKYHPDKLQHMDEAYRKGAEEKFRKVQEAYEQIRKERQF